MRHAAKIGIVLVLLISSARLAFAQNRTSLIISNDKLVLQVDISSSRQVLDSLFNVAGISGVKSADILHGNFADVTNQGWTVSSRQGNLVSFERSLTDLNYDPQNKPYKITTRIPNFEGKPGYPAEVKYGVNKYAKITVYELASGLTRFILPGYYRAKRVFLSGSFNDWSTLKGAMKKTDGGWILDLKLDPGAYEYKYIIDGRWTTDPNNLQQVNDGGGHINSVYFKYNYTFRVAGSLSAQRVMVAGNFNDWNANELVMEKDATGWERPMYLAEGKYYYRFMVDGQWTTDKANHLKIKNKEENTPNDQYADLNSVLYIGEKVVFKLTGHTDARSVVLAGDFDTLSKADREFERKGNAWFLPLTLSARNYDYAFLVDGKPVMDPTNPHYSVKNGEKWSFLAVKPNYTFKLKGYDGAKSVTLCGVFNNWQPDGYTMAHDKGEWVISFHLKPGKYLYKFRVDGQWIIDPGNKLWEQNEYGTGNSVLWIE